MPAVAYTVSLLVPQHCEMHIITQTHISLAPLNTNQYNCVARILKPDGR